jgi:hypothetical protein
VQSSSGANALKWGVAVVVAAALFALPVLALNALEVGTAGWFVAVATDLLILVLYAARKSSPLVVLAAVAVVGAGEAVFFVMVIAGNTCGGSTTAGLVEWIGAAVIALALGAWGVLHGLHVFWAAPLALVCAGGWIVLTANLVPGGVGLCIT